MESKPSSSSTPKDRVLEVVNEQDIVVGLKPRSVIHEKGLFHREVHVWFITPSKEIIFQKRAEDKDTAPGLLDATVGGHVEPGQDYETAAHQEMLEETGVMGNPISITKTKNIALDHLTGKHNNCFRMIFGHIYKGSLSDLKIEKGKGTGFFALPYASLLNGQHPLYSQIIPVLLNPTYMDIYKKLTQLVGERTGGKATIKK